MSTTKGGIEHKIYVKILNWPNSVALMCFYLRLAIVCVLKFISIDYHLIRKIKVKREKKQNKKSRGTKKRGVQKIQRTKKNQTNEKSGGQYLEHEFKSMALKMQKQGP